MIKSTDRGHFSHVYGADFETDNNGEEAWVVQWAVSNGSSEHHGSSIESFSQFLLDLMASKPLQDTIVYFHNLRYDVQFMRGMLRRMADEQYMDLVTMLRQGRPIMIQLKATDNSLVSGSLTFRDSALKMPGTLKAMARSVGLRKLESPRHGFAPGWSKDLDYSEGSEDWKYIDMDARIVAVAMRHLHKTGRSRATVSSDAWMWAKDSLRRTPKGKYPKGFKWESLFPHLDPELDMTLRRGYMGGLNISQHPGETIATPDAPIVHEDVHSMYPSVMYYDPLPVGVPTITGTWPEDYVKCWIGHFYIRLKLKEGCTPWFQFKNGLDNQLEGWQHGTLVTETKAWHEMILTNIDIATLERWYDLEYHPDWQPVFWVFKSETGIFRDYIDYWFGQKERPEKGGIDYISAKLMLNSLYGRFALAPEGEHDTIVWNPEIDDWDFRAEPTVAEEMDSYLPYAMFITSYARWRLLDNALAVGPENVIHCDTDSVIHIGEPSPDIEHGDVLATWGIESRPLRILEGGFKRYVEVLREPIRSHHDLSMACAGVPQQVNDHDVPIGMWVEILDDPSIITMTGYQLGHSDYRIESQWLREMYINDGMDPDSVNTFKLIPRKVKGGVILEERTHVLNDNMIYRLRR